MHGKYFFSLPFFQYTLPSTMELQKITVSSWIHPGSNPSGNVGYKQPAFRIYQRTGMGLLLQPSAFEFWPAGYYFGDTSKERFMMTAILKNSLVPFQMVRTEYDSLPVDRWIYASTTYDGFSGSNICYCWSAGARFDTINPNGLFYLHINIAS